MKITVEFDTWEEMELFRTSGKKTRSKKEEAADEAAEQPAKAFVAAQLEPAQPQPVMGQPIAATAQSQPSHGFPGVQAAPQPAPIHPIADAIITKIDGAIASGQPADAIVAWFRQQIGPDAVNASLDQLKQVFIPRMQEAQLKQIAPQLGIAG